MTDSTPHLPPGVIAERILDYVVANAPPQNRHGPHLPAGAARPARTISGDEIRTSRIVGALVPCGHVRYFAGCLLAEVDSLRGTVTEAGIDGGTHSAIYGTAGARLSAEIELVPHLSLRPAVDLLLALRRPALYAEGVSRWEVPAVSGRVGVGLLASF